MPGPATAPSPPQSALPCRVPHLPSRLLLGGLAALVLVLAACRIDTATMRETAQVGPGMQITMHYTLRLRDETLIRTTVHGKPFSYIHGRSELLPALERGIEGLRPGDRTTLIIVAQEAFGLYNDAKVDALPRHQFPPDVTVGAEFEDQIGRTLRVVEVGTETVLVDWNHPLAGEDLVVEVSVVDVRTPDGQVGTQP